MAGRRYSQATSSPSTRPRVGAGTLNRGPFSRPGHLGSGRDIGQHPHLSKLGAAGAGIVHHVHHVLGRHAGGAPRPEDKTPKPPARTGWDLLDAQSVKIDDFGMPRAATHLARFLVSTLQSLFNGMAARTLARPVKLDELEIIVGSNDGRGRFLSERGSLIPTPGDTPAGYTVTLRSVLHELAHQIQSRSYGEIEFLRKWREEDEQYGEGAYFRPGTLEYDADQFMEAVLIRREHLGL